MRAQRNRNASTVPTGALIPPDQDHPDEWTIREFLYGLRAGMRPRLRSEASLRLYEAAVRSLSMFLWSRGMPELRNVTREHMQEWVLWMKDAGKSANTMSAYRTVVKLFYEWLIEEGERRDNPTDRVHAPAGDKRLRSRYSREEIDALFASQDGRTLIGARNLALFAVLLDTGVRREECVSIQTDQVDWKHGTITVMGKGRKERQVRVGATTQRLLAAYQRIRSRDARHAGPWLWVAQGGGQLSAAGLAHVHGVLTRRLGFHVHAHAFRHTFAQMALDNGMDRESLRLLLGHESLETTRIYTEASDRQRAIAAHTRYSPMDNLRRGKR